MRFRGLDSTLGRASAGSLPLPCVQLRVRLPAHLHTNHAPAPPFATSPGRPGRTPIPRGTILRPDTAAALPSRDHLHLGVGRAVDSRVALFRSSEGLAIEMVQRVYDIPPVNGGCWQRRLPDCPPAQLLACYRRSCAGALVQSNRMPPVSFT